jgi:hypothetical protein
MHGIKIKIQNFEINHSVHFAEYAFTKPTQQTSYIFKSMVFHYSCFEMSVPSSGIHTQILNLYLELLII